MGIWIALILAALLGALVGWLLCAFATVRLLGDEYEAGRRAGRREEQRRQAEAKWVDR